MSFVLMIKCWFDLPEKMAARPVFFLVQLVDLFKILGGRQSQKGKQVTPFSRQFCR